MKLPKTVNRYCPFCKKHTEQKIIQSKAKTRGSAHPLSYGSKARIKKRGRLGMGNQGKYSKPPISKWSMAGRKASKKTDLRFQCKDCKKQTNQRLGFRAKKVEFE